MKHGDLSQWSRAAFAVATGPNAKLVWTVARVSHKRPRLAAFGTLFGCLLVAMLASQPAAVWAAVRSFEISQTALLEGSPTTIRSYVRVVDDRNQPVDRLDRSAITGTLGERELQVRGLQPFYESGEGVAYIFLVDVSRSLSEREFALIQRSIEDWTANLRPQDRAAILAFGDESRLVLDFTNEADRLRQSVGSLGPTDSSTVLFEAIHNGFELARRRDANLPGRRVLIVLTDGRDEGSGWSLDDTLGLLRREPTPIYAIGLSRIRNTATRDRYLGLLRRLATNSGGAFFEGSTATLADAYGAIRRAIHEVWVLDFSCSDCRRDGESYRLQANLSDGQRLLSDGQAIRLLPPTAPVGAVDEPETMQEERDVDAGDVSASPAARQESGSGWSWLWLVLPLLAAAIGWLLWSLRSPAPTAPESDLEDLPPAGPVPAPSYTTADGLETSRPPRPDKLRVVRLIVVRGSKPGKQYSITLLDKAVVGARSTCDCVLYDEPGAAPEQFELYQRDGHVFVRNLSDEHPTLVDGLPTDSQHRIQSEALVGTRDFIVRVIFGEGRATARL